MHFLQVFLLNCSILVRAEYTKRVSSSEFKNLQQHCKPTKNIDDFKKSFLQTTPHSTTPHFNTSTLCLVLNGNGLIFSPHKPNSTEKRNLQTFQVHFLQTNMAAETYAYIREPACNVEKILKNIEDFHRDINKLYPKNENEKLRLSIIFLISIQNWTKKMCNSTTETQIAARNRLTARFLSRLTGIETDEIPFTGISSEEKIEQTARKQNQNSFKHAIFIITALFIIKLINWGSLFQKFDRFELLLRTNSLIKLIDVINIPYTMLWSKLFNLKYTINLKEFIQYLTSEAWILSKKFMSTHQYSASQISDPIEADDEDTPLPASPTMIKTQEEHDSHTSINIKLQRSTLQRSYLRLKLRAKIGGRRRSIAPFNYEERLAVTRMQLVNESEPWFSEEIGVQLTRNAGNQRRITIMKTTKFLTEFIFFTIKLTTITSYLSTGSPYSPVFHAIYLWEKLQVV